MASKLLAHSSIIGTSRCFSIPGGGGRCWHHHFGRWPLIAGWTRGQLQVQISQRDLIEDCALESARASPNRAGVEHLDFGRSGWQDAATLYLPALGITHAPGEYEASPPTQSRSTPRSQPDREPTMSPVRSTGTGGRDGNQHRRTSGQAPRWAGRSRADSPTPTGERAPRWTRSLPGNLGLYHQAVTTLIFNGPRPDTQGYRCSSANMRAASPSAAGY